MRNTDPVVPRLQTSGIREPTRGATRRTLGGTLATVALLLTVLFVLAAPPTLLVGLLLGVAVGGGAKVVMNRREAATSTRICIPRADICIRL